MDISTPFRDEYFSLVFHFSPVLGEKWKFLTSFTKYARNAKFSLLLSHEKKALFHAWVKKKLFLAKVVMVMSQAGVPISLGGPLENLPLSTRVWSRMHIARESTSSLSYVVKLLHNGAWAHFSHWPSYKQAHPLPTNRREASARDRAEFREMFTRGVFACIF